MVIIEYMEISRTGIAQKVYTAVYFLEQLGTSKDIDVESSSP